ncbi:MAG TPA: DUF935 family protein [Acidobacteriaceae bacterium]|jgi:phage gp29-like protein
MADPTSAPPSGQIVTTGVLQQAMYAQWRNAAAFTGMRDPSQTWAMMMRGDGWSIPFYRELEDKDEDVSSALDELRFSVLEREWNITPGDQTAAAIDAATEMKAQLDALDFDSIAESMLDACGYGYSVQEMMFDSSAGQARLIGIDDCPQEMFSFGPTFQPQVGQMQLLQTFGSSTGTPMPEEKFLIFSYRGRARSRVGRPLIRGAFWPSWFKRQVLGMWLKAGAKGNGTALTRYADGATDAEKQQAVEAAEALVEGVAFAIPEGMEIDVELLRVAKSSDSSLFEKLFEKSQYSIARAIKGETLTSHGNEGGRGSQAQGETHQQTFQQRSISLAKKHARVLNVQCVRQVHLWNYGPNVAAPVFGWDIAEEEDLVQKSTLFTNAQRMGIQIGARWAADQLQIPPIEANDVALTPNVNAATEPVPATAFNENTPAARQAHADLADMDELARQLKDNSLEMLRTRIGEVAGRLMPSGSIATGEGK